MICEMLVQSHLGHIELLPLLPEQWSRGSLKGLACRGAITIDELTWQSRSIRLSRHATQAQQLTLLFPAPILSIQAPDELHCQWLDTQVELTLPAQQSMTLDIRIAP